MTTPNNAVLLKKMVELYIKNIVNPTPKKTSEMEIRFGDDKHQKLSKKEITRIDFDNVVKHLKVNGFTLNGDLGDTRETPEQYYLRIIDTTLVNETKQKRQLKSSNVRLEIRGIDMIQKYCKYNDIQKIIDESSQRAEYMMKFTKKIPPTDDPSFVSMVKFDDYNYRVSYKLEEDFPIYSPKSKESIATWQNNEKIFRFIKRYRFSHPTLPVFIDLSIVKTNSRDKKNSIFIPTATVQQANLFHNPESYEIEVEINNREMKNFTTDSLLGGLRKTIHIILCGLQKTNYPISYIEQDRVLSNYLQLIHTEKTEKYNGRPIRNSDFFGPSSETLQIENLFEKSKINILKDYSVTDKADGDRKLLYICPVDKGDTSARIYLIDSNMNVVFTGKQTVNKELYHTLIDGEHILYDKTGNHINQYMAFDIYFAWQKEDESKTANKIVAVRNYKFIRSKDNETETDKNKNKYRYKILQQKVKDLNDSLIMDKCSFVINVKMFYSKDSIFESCASILNNNEFLTYNTDGLIFTPCSSPVPIDTRGAGFKVTWNQSFKWKPTEYNTIDFYVKSLKNKDGKEMIKNDFIGGQDLSNSDIDQPYKVIELRCGYSKRNRNSYNDVLKLIKNEYVSTDKTNAEYKDNYTAELFKPTNPFDPLAYLCYVRLQRNESNQFVMKTKEGDIFDENSIVEFSYDTEGDYPSNAYRWIPLRVRNDKTAKLLSGQKEYGNAFHVANNNWHSIHFPISSQILMTGEGIPSMDTELYYENNPESKKNNTKALRNFHNIVKKLLIRSVSRLNAEKTLIDYAVGKAGDLQKWKYDSKLDFVFGIDIFRDNIINEKDGACIRYIEDYEDNVSSNFKALFVVGDSSQHIRSGDAIATPQEKDITRSVFSTPGQHYDLGGKYNGIGKNGFQISSCQFAVHYFFKNQNTLHGFLRNVAECTKLGGYFIGTTYDGQLVFDQLAKYKKGEGVVLSRKRGTEETDTDILFKITKQYEETGFPDDENGLGYTVSVFQDSIGKEMDEYLVNFTYFERLMTDYGFSLVDTKTENIKEFKKGSGTFKDVFNEIMNQLKSNPTNYEYKRMKDEMKDDEKFISFLNRYFIFKKVSEVDTANVYKIIKEKTAEKPEKPPKKPFSGKKISKYEIKKFEPIE